MNRRRFLKNASGVFVPACFGIIKATAQQYRFGSQLRLAAASGGGSCNISADSIAGSDDTSTLLGLSDVFTYNSWRYVAAATYTMCRIDVRMEKVGSPTFTSKMFIYTDSAGKPGSQLGGSSPSSAFSISSLSSSVVGNASFVSMTAAIVSGTTYWLVQQAIGSPNDSTNYAKWFGANTGGASDQNYRSIDAVTWVSTNSNVKPVLTAYHS